MIHEFVGYRSYYGECEDGPLYNMAVTDEPIIRCCDCKCGAVDQSDHEYREPYKCKKFNFEMKDLNGFCAWPIPKEKVSRNVSAYIVPKPSDSDFVNDWKFKCSNCGCFVDVDEIELNEDEPPTIIRHANYCANCGKKLHA